jgi:hypothetical protein
MRQTELWRTEMATLRAMLTGSGTTGSRPSSETGAHALHETLLPSDTNGFLRGTSLEVRETLTVGGDARIGGDLHLDGSLVLQELYVPGSISVENTVHAGRFAAGSGSRIDGTLLLDGPLRMGTGALRFASGAFVLSDLLVERALFVVGDVTIAGLARFFGIVEVHSELRLPIKQAGRAVIPADGTLVVVRFGTGFTTIPVVTATPEHFVLSAWRVHPVTATGFTIELQRPTPVPLSFAWHAFPTVEEHGVAPTAPHEAVESPAPIPFPLDAAGVPVSSDAVWNACIRAVSMTDPDGNPYDCLPFHDGTTWRHPDLSIAFVWNTDARLAGPFLHVPPGYVPVVTESVISVEEGMRRTPPEDDVRTDVPATATGATSEETMTVSPAPDVGSVDVPLAEEEAAPMTPEMPSSGAVPDASVPASDDAAPADAPATPDSDS